MASFIIWSLDMLAEYADYAIGRNLIFLETDKMLSASIRDALIEGGHHVILNPRKRDFREYAYYMTHLYLSLQEKRSMEL